MTRRFFLGLLAVAVAAPAFALSAMRKVRTLCVGHGKEYATIDIAMSHAESGDTIMICSSDDGDFCWSEE